MRPAAACRPGVVLWRSTSRSTAVSTIWHSWISRWSPSPAGPTAGTEHSHTGSGSIRDVPSPTRRLRAACEATVVGHIGPWSSGGSCRFEGPRWEHTPSHATQRAAWDALRGRQRAGRRNESAGRRGAPRVVEARCDADGEGWLPQLLCDHRGGGEREEVWLDGVQLLLRHGHT